MAPEHTGNPGAGSPHDGHADAQHPDGAHPDAHHPDTEHPAAVTARQVVRSLVGAGVADVVLAPGSRSAPLAYALHSAQQAGWLNLHVRIDERAAAFVAVGIARHRPVAVVTTSGTAVANLHPAVLEASHSGLPLVVLSADRPHEMRGVGANQTTDQVGIFASAVRWQGELPAAATAATATRGVDAAVLRAVTAARGTRSGHPGPVHVNIAFRDPLTPAAPWQLPGAPWEPQGRPDGGVVAGAGLTGAGPAGAAAQPVDAPAGPAAGPVSGQPAGGAVAPAAGPVTGHPVGGATGQSAGAATVLARGPRTLIVAGDGADVAGTAGRAFAATSGWPVLAEPTSGLRHLPQAVAAPPVVAEVLGEGVQRVVVLGRTTLTRQISALLARRDLEVIVAAPGPDWVDVAGTATLITQAVTVAGEPSAAERDWTRQWQSASEQAGAALADLGDQGLSGPLVARMLLAGDADRAGGDGGASHAGPGTAAAGTAAGAAGDSAGPGTAGGSAGPGPGGPGPAVGSPADSAAAGSVLLGSSMAVRDADLAAGAGAEFTSLPVLANRGLAGIDGTISTATGVALATGAPVRALMGDLTFQHDVGGLARGPLEAEVDLQIIVLNDDGGSIFATLEHGRRELAQVYPRIFGTPQGLDIGALARGFGASHRVVTDVAELRALLSEPVRGRSVLEVVLDGGTARQRARDLRERIRRRVAGAAG